MTAPARWLGPALAALAALALALPASAEPDACCAPVEPAAAAPIAAALAPVSLTDQRGKTVALPDGRVWVVTFFYGQCRDVCPTLLYNLGSVAEALPAPLRQKVAFGGVSFDPARDTVPRLAEYQHNFELTADNTYLMTGDRPSLERVFKAFSFSHKADRDGAFQHVNMLAVMDGRGRIVRHFYGLQPDIEQVTSLVSRLVASPAP